MFTEGLPSFLRRGIKPTPRIEFEAVMLGCDPELFVFNKETGLPISVHNILPGTKSQPAPVPRGSIQVDGVAAEFNIKPAATRTIWLKNIKEVQKVLGIKLREKNPKLEIRYTPIIEFTSGYFATVPEQSKRLGCEPDYNAYTGRENCKPDEAQDKPVRSAGGHVHVGWKDVDPDEDCLLPPEHFDLCCNLTKELDFVLYNTSRLWDSDERRRSIYGKPGSFRPKKYGMEYRVLSNMWLQDDKFQTYVYDATKAVSVKFLKGHEISSKFPRQLVDLKDEHDYEIFSNFLDSQDIPSPRLMGIR